MAEIVALQTRPLANNADCIEILKRLLGQAEAGQIEAIAVAVVHMDGSCETESSSTDNLQKLIGSIAILQHRTLELACEATRL